MSLENASNGNATAAGQLAIRLVSRISRHEIPNSRFFVPSDWKRFQLSELINNVLEYEKPVPFDFIVEGELLRTSLANYVNAKGLSEETVLELEYVESMLPPEYVSAFEHQDWVSDIDMCRSGLFLSACYDGSVNVFSSSGHKKARIDGHTLPALSACWVKSGHEELIASGGMDRVIRILKLAEPSTAPDRARQSHSLVYSLPLHSQPVASVRASDLPSAAPRLLSSGWDGQVALWSLDASKEGAEGENSESGRSVKKRRRTDDTSSAPRLAPVHVLRGHSGQVPRAVFDRSDATRAYSCGWDHSVRIWDLNVGGQSSAKAAADKVLLDIDQMASTNLLVTGSTDRTVCFWDTRQDSSAISLTLQGHTAPVSSVRAHPTSPVLVLSGGYDGVMRVWDVRSTKQALFAVRRQQTKPDAGTLDNKILCAEWDEHGALIGTGGEDGRIELHRASTRLGNDRTPT